VSASGVCIVNVAPKAANSDAATSPFTYPALSVVIEWENARNSEKARGVQMLRCLFAQLSAIDNRFTAAPEIIIVHDVDDGSAGQILAEIKAEQPTFRGTPRTCPCDGLDYYDQKNLGAREARGEAILFVDSDVIPEDGWLEALLECYIQEAPDAVAGATYIHGPSLYDRAFALFWFFPTETDYHTWSRSPTKNFFANNVIFRTSVFRPIMFPDAPIVRGRCSMLADKLVKSGHSIIFEPRARTQHPAPNGVKHFVYRALCEGHDNLLMNKSTDRNRLGALRRLLRNMLRSSARIATRHREVGLNLFGALGAMVVAFAYYSLAFCGELIAMVSPHFIRRSLRV
jgi:glycosyltransferase involved in cell wall biosynthesis